MQFLTSLVASSRFLYATGSLNNGCHNLTVYLPKSSTVRREHHSAEEVDARLLQVRANPYNGANRLVFSMVIAPYEQQLNNE